MQHVRKCHRWAVTSSASFSWYRLNNRSIFQRSEINAQCLFNYTLSPRMLLFIFFTHANHKSPESPETWENHESLLLDVDAVPFSHFASALRLKWQSVLWLNRVIKIKIILSDSQRACGVNFAKLYTYFNVNAHCLVNCIVGNAFNLVQCALCKQPQIQLSVQQPYAHSRLV